MAAIGVALLLVLALADPIDRIERQYTSFVELRPSSASDSRFTSGAGNRYDYWRVALNQFVDEPLTGIGAGNYDTTYFRERRTSEDVRQPHSIELQVLGELGVVGLAALAVFVVAVLGGFARRCRAARRDLRARALAVGAGGMFLFWLLHTSVDWLHLIPGVTGLALAAGAVLVGPWGRPARPTSPYVRRALGFGAAVIIVFAAVLVGRAALAETYRADARAALGRDATTALAKADDSLLLDDEALDTYYVKAAAYARLDDYARARATLLEATAREPSDFVTWGLLGDLAVRRHAFDDARRAYRTAARLNPRNEALVTLARDPQKAVQP